MSKEDWVAASAAGRAAFCPKYLELKKNGSTVSDAAKAARARGEIEHENFNAQIKSQTADRRCFIASHLYGVDDPRTEALRRFRDVHLMPNRPGRVFVRAYYALSPALVRVCRRFSMVDSITRNAVNWLVARLSDRKER